MKSLEERQELVKTIIFFGFIIIVSLGLIFNMILKTPEPEKVINISPGTAYAKMLTTVNITIIDATPCGSCYIESHIKNAVRSIEPTEFYGHKGDIIVYSKEGVASKDYAKSLLGNVDGVIYNIIGGKEAWIDNKLPVVKG